MLSRKIKKSLFMQLIKIFKVSNIDQNSAGGVQVLTFHNFNENEIKLFKNFIHFLKEKYKFINPEEFLFYKNQKSNKPPILLTFDDGFYSNYKIAKHVLQPLSIKAIFFVPTSFINRTENENKKSFIENNLLIKSDRNSYAACANPMKWKHLKELVENGNVIGSHTKNHYVLSKIKDEKILIDEVINSGSLIEDKLKTQVEHFAYPFGTLDSIDEKVVLKASQRYKYIFTNIRGINNNNTSLKAIRRQGININDELHYNDLVVNGNLSFVTYFQRRKLDNLI